MTTRAKTPSIRRVRVKVERSLWAQSSTRPPLMISHPRESRAPNERWRGRAIRPVEVPVVGTARPLTTSLIAQRLHGRQARRLPRREEGEDETKDGGQQIRRHKTLGVDVERDADRGGDDLREPDADDQARERSHPGQKQRLRHELFEDFAAGRA